MPKALWLYRHRKDLAAPFSLETEQRLAVGHNVGAIAQQYFHRHGPSAEVQAPFWNVEEGAGRPAAFWKKAKASSLRPPQWRPTFGATAASTF